MNTTLENTVAQDISIDNVVANYKNGTWIAVDLDREGEVYKNKGYEALNIRKHSKMVVRMGLTYDKLAQTQELRASGDIPAENAGLPFGEWKAFPYIIKHTDKKGVYTEYVRLYANFGQIKVQWTMNGVPVKKSEIERFLTAKEKQTHDEKTPILTLSPKTHTIVKVAGVTLDEAKRQDRMFADNLAEKVMLDKARKAYLVEKESVEGTKN